MKEDGAQALVGAARSAVSMPLAMLSKIDQMPQCSYWSSSPSLSDTLLYPYCAPPSAGFARRAVAPSHRTALVLACTARERAWLLR